MFSAVRTAIATKTMASKKTSKKIHGCTKEKPKLPILARLNALQGAHLRGKNYPEKDKISSFRGFTPLLSLLGLEFESTIVQGKARIMCPSLQPWARDDNTHRQFRNPTPHPKLLNLALCKYREHAPKTPKLSKSAAPQETQRL